MAFWDKISSRGHVEDRRGLGGVAIGGASVTGLAIILLFNVLTGGDLTDVINQLPNVALQEQTAPSQEFDGEDSYELFASRVLGSANDKWKEVFAAQNLPYTEPRLVLFRTATDSSCGTAVSQVGPHYCPNDKTIYLDETFFEELTSKLGAQGGDVAEAYVIAHEAGHHAQNELGILETYSGGSNEISVLVELQADCFAGMWAHSIRGAGVFEQNEIQEAMDAAAAVGDDRIQQRTTGTVNAETWTHGSSAQRMEWFNKGYESGSLAACNTFN